MIYLYGLLRATAPPALDELAGVSGSVAATQLATGWLIHGAATEAEILPKRRHLLAHTRVLETVMQAGTLLPMRFGLIARDVDEIATLIAARETEIAARLAALDGRVEAGLRIAFPRDAALAATLADDPRLAREHQRLAALTRPPHFELAEFGRRLAEALDARRTAAQKALLAGLADTWDDHILKPPESDVQVLCAECLVARDALDATAARAEEAARRIAGFAGGAEPEVRLVGPVPPFHFVDLALAPADPVGA
ncbi:gas vesicle protein [Rhodobacterales bacterium HKCCE3408]|nr:gas vesicle protein [Rhodobacterales bacterium HKCCE3408]